MPYTSSPRVAPSTSSPQASHCTSMTEAAPVTSIPKAVLCISIPWEAPCTSSLQAATCISSPRVAPCASSFWAAPCTFPTYFKNDFYYIMNYVVNSQKGNSNNNFNCFKSQCPPYSPNRLPYFAPKSKRSKCQIWPINLSTRMDSRSSKWAQG